MSYNLSVSDANALRATMNGETNKQSLQQIQAWIEVHQEPHHLQDPELVRLEELAQTSDKKEGLLAWIRKFKSGCANTEKATKGSDGTQLKSDMKPAKEATNTDSKTML